MRTGKPGAADQTTFGLTTFGPEVTEAQRDRDRWRVAAFILSPWRPLVVAHLYCYIRNIKILYTVCLTASQLQIPSELSLFP